MLPHSKEPLYMVVAGMRNRAKGVSLGKSLDLSILSFYKLTIVKDYVISCSNADFPNGMESTEALGVSNVSLGANSGWFLSLSFC